MKKIHKYELKGIDEQVITLPKNIEILCVQNQNERICMWVILDPEAPTTNRTFVLYGTGYNISQPLSKLCYVGTFQLMGGNYIGHLFEKIK